MEVFMKTNLTNPGSAVLLLLIIYFMIGLSSHYGQNLILNPGCEDTLVNGEIPYWTEAAGTNWTQRSANPDPLEGDYYFFPGVAAQAELQQEIDVSGYASSIDNSEALFVFNGFVRSYAQSPPDLSRIIIEYLDSLKTAKLDSFDSGDYSNTTIWEEISDSTIAPQATRYIRIRLLSTRKNGSNNDGYYDSLSLRISPPVDIRVEDTNRAAIPVLYQNYPNPFNPSTMIEYWLPQGSQVDLSIYNILGKKIITLVSEKQQSGLHRTEWDASGLASGIYIYVLKTGEFTELKKMVLIK